MAKYAKKSQAKVKRAMEEMKEGTLKSGSGKKVTDPKQAIAIGLSEAREEGAKVPKKASSKKSATKAAPKKAAKKAAPKKAAGKAATKKAAMKKSAKKATPKKAATKTAKKSAGKK